MTAIAIGGLALSAGSTVVQGIGQRRAMEAQAAQAERAGKIAKIQANQISTDYQNELRGTLATIRAIRGSVGASASPTEYAVLSGERDASERGRRIRVTGARMQATQYERDAGTYRSAGRFALLGSVIGAGANLATGYTNFRYPAGVPSG